jgi:hypothetical protein
VLVLWLGCWLFFYVEGNFVWRVVDVTIMQGTVASSSSSSSLPAAYTTPASVYAPETICDPDDSPIVKKWIL